MADGRAPAPVLDLTPAADSYRLWWTELRRHAGVLLVLARKDFQTRYKRASLGVAWAVAVPVLQGAVMAVIFTRVVRSGTGSGYVIYVMGGVAAYSYFASVLGTSVTSIVDGAALTDKVWFPRVILVVVPSLSNLVGLVVSVVVLVALMPAFGVDYSVRLLLLVPAIGLLAALVTSLGLVVSALQVYFRDVRFIVQAALMVWMYLTPVIYPIGFLHRLRIVAIANPLTGPVSLFHMATVGSRGLWVAPLVVSLSVTAILLVVGAEVQRRYDRLFVDLL
ncbi:MAG TPA: ABC transporter permease [Acidimicrobiales bacterium]|nr:ABC transporter permease [Acidimicrobiales bacterium]